MDIEQHSPKKPNFLLVVLLAAATILVVFVLAYMFVDFEGGRIHFRPHPHPTSQFVMPTATGVIAVA